MFPLKHDIFKYLPKKRIGSDDELRISYWLKKLYEQKDNKSSASGNIQKTIISQESKNSDKASNNYYLSQLNQIDKNLEAQAHAQYIKDQVQKMERNTQKVEELVRKSNRCIIRLSTFFSSIFPWSLYASTVEVEEGRVIFIFRQPLSFQTHNVDLKDISNVLIESGIFFATLHIISRTFVENNIRVTYLRKNKALYVKSIIEGLRTFSANNIDTSNYEIEQLIEKLDELHVNPRVENINQSYLVGSVK